MKNLLLSTALLLAACSSIPTGSSASVPAQNGSVVVQNWPLGKTAKVLFATSQIRGTEFYSSEVSSDGTLSYNLSAPSDLSTPTLSPGASCTGSINVTPTDWKMARMGSVPVYIGGNTESPADGFISISPASNELTNLQEGQSILDDWIYVDRDTAITGSTQCTNPSSNSTFNMQLKAGWNFRLIKLVKMVNGQLTQVELYAAQTLPSNYKLKYSPRTTATK